MKQQRFKLITEAAPIVYNSNECMYHIVDTKLNWRIASNIEMQPNGEPVLEVAEAMVEFLNQRYGNRNPVVDEVLKS